MEAGTKVCIKGLIKAAHFNGKIGHVVKSISSADTADRIAIKLHGGKILAVKTSNLDIVDDASKKHTEPPPSPGPMNYETLEENTDNLFRDPPPREECPICLLPLPWEDVQMTYMSCCGKTICFGCTCASGLAREDSMTPPCAFCRTPPPKDHRENNERVNERMERNDADAYRDRAAAYELGDREGGFRKDEARAFELFARAAELGSVDAYTNLGNSYKNGRGVAIDMEKAKRNYQIAAIGGSAIARNNLGATEACNGNFSVAMRHFMISVGAGWNLPALEMGYKHGFINKRDFDKTLDAYNNSVEEMKSEQRDVAARVALARRLG